jgi:adenylosuccinate lyase
VSELSDKVGVLLSELGEQEDVYAHNLDDARSVLKTIRNTEKSVQPSRDNRQKIQDEIHKLKMKEPENTRLVVLEQELVRAEAENLVAEAQLTNIVCYTTFYSWSPNACLHNSRLAKSSRRPTPLSSPLLSSAPRSRSFSPVTAAAC